MSGEGAVFFIIVILIATIFIVCIKAICRDDPIPAYSAPVIVTSQSHQPPGSSRSTTILNQNSRPPGQYPPSSNSPHLGFTSNSPRYSPNANAPYPPQNSYPPESSYPPRSHSPSQPAYPQQMPMPSNMPYPSAAPYPPQIGSSVPYGQNVSQPSAPPPSAPQPSAPYPTNFSSQDMDVPPNYVEAMTILSKEQKKL